MGLFDFFKRQPAKKNVLEDIKSTFHFLLTDFGFTLISVDKFDEYKADYFLTYRNDQSKLQVEVCADQGWLHCELRRLINGEPAKYYDEENSIGFESLAILESDNNYEHMDYFAGGIGLAKVLHNTADLFKRNKVIFTTETWVDTKKIQRLRDEESQIKFGFKPSDNKNKPTYFGELKKEATKFLTENGFKLILDSEELSPFDKRKMASKIIYKKEDKNIRLAQQDWRDNYFLYNIDLNGNQMFQMNIREHQDINEAVRLTMQKLKQLI
jgi:hypothetical protein